MNERLDHARRLGGRIRTGWQREDVEAQLARLHARQRARVRRLTLALPLGAVAIASLVVAVVASRGHVQPVLVVPLAPAAAADRAPPEAKPVPPVVARVEQPPSSEPERSAVTPGEIRPAPARPHDPVRPAVDGAAPAPAQSSTWRDDASRGDYPAAWAELARTGASTDTMTDLLLAADVARMSGHAGAAVASLARSLELHADDARAPLAAFTLGRVQLEDLGAPRAAALAFARAIELAPEGPLAEDALAREVEAWSRAGETEIARARALTYTQRYPDGRRARAVRRFGGLETP
jgi:transmembrane sensor